MSGSDTEPEPDNVYRSCQGCGCSCDYCPDDGSASNQALQQLQQEFSTIQQKLAESETYIAELEVRVKELDVLRGDLLTWKDKYKRLHDGHKRVQKVNQGLEEKLLRLVEVKDVEKNIIEKDMAIVTHKLAEANYTVKKLTAENERYKSDVSLAVQFLQCKNGSFVTHKYETLPRELRLKITDYLMNRKASSSHIEKRRHHYEPKSIKVPVPNAAVLAAKYQQQSNSDDDEEDGNKKPIIDVVSAAIMAKVFEEREREKALIKHCDNCFCSHTGSDNASKVSSGTQTTISPPLDAPANASRADIVQNVAKVSPNNYLGDELNVKSSNHPDYQKDSDQPVIVENGASSMTDDNVRTGINKARRGLNKLRESFPNVSYFSIGEKPRKNRVTKFGAYESLHSYGDSQSDTSSVLCTDDEHDEEDNIDEGDDDFEEEDYDEDRSFTLDPMNDSGISINNSYVKTPGKDVPQVQSELCQTAVDLMQLHGSSDIDEHDKVLSQHEVSLEKIGHVEDSESNGEPTSSSEMAAWSLDEPVTAAEAQCNQDTSQSSAGSLESLAKDELDAVDRGRYEAMERNVKRFLFGDISLLSLE